MGRFRSDARKGVRRFHTFHTSSERYGSRKASIGAALPYLPYLPHLHPRTYAGARAHACARGRGNVHFQYGRCGRYGRTSSGAGFELPYLASRYGTGMEHQGRTMRSMREEMPRTAEFIDELRRVFGADQVDPAIRAGLDGQPTFYATENGHEIGCRDSIAAPAQLVQVGVEMPAQWQRKAKG